MPRKAGLVLALSSVVALLLVCSVPAYAQSTITADNGVSAIPGSIKPTTDVDMGEFSSPQMAVYVVLAPRNESELSDLLANVYNPKSDSYRHWLGKGEFYSRFAPSDAQTAAIADYLRASGLVVEQSSSPFLVRASGPSSTAAAAFRTTLRTYRNQRGIDYFSNASAVHLPTSLASGVLGVVGLSNTVRLQSHVVLPLKHTSPPVPSCEAPYPTTAQLFAAVNSGTPFPFGYGGGPGCNGLTPSQDNSIYGAPNLGSRGKGAGVSLAVFELSAYTQSDITTWAHTFYGPAYTPPLVNINVDGGPLSTSCPAGDECFPGYSGDIEVDADIEMQLAIAPDARHILVYNAPNDNTGQTELDEYARIAKDDTADVVSSSWGICENDAGAAYVQAENVIFEQMALQGQSMFASAGDDGAFDCIGDGTGTIVNVEDPGAQPWVTSVVVLPSNRSIPTRTPIQNTRQAWRQCGMSTTYVTRVRRARPTTTWEGSSGAPQQARVAAGTANSGAALSTSLGRASRTLTRRTAMARHNARWRQWESRAERFRTSPPMPTSTRPMLNTAPGPIPPAHVAASAAPKFRLAGSASAAPAYRRHSGRRSSRTTTASGTAGSATRTRFFTCCIT